MTTSLRGELVIAARRSPELPPRTHRRRTERIAAERIATPVELAWGEHISPVAKRVTIL
jgi:hypothetical protein